MPITLKNLAIAEQATYTTARDNGRAALLAAQAATASAQTLFDGALAAQKTLEGTLAGDRAKLAATAVPAEIDALATKIRDETVDLREQVWVVSDAKDALDAARNQQAFVESRLQRAEAELKAAGDALVEATQEADRRGAWVTAAGLPPLSTLRQQATDAADGTNGSTLLADALAKFTTAPTRVPQELLDVAKLRVDLWRDRAKASRDAVAFVQARIGAQAFADLGKAGAAQQLGIAFRAAEAAFGDWVSSAESRFDRAVTLLQNIANLGAGVFAIGEPEATEANDPTDPQASDRQSAADDEEAIYPAQAAVDQKQATLNDEILKAQAVDPNKADVSGDGGVPAATTALTTAQGTLAPLVAAFDAPEKGTMAYWQVRLGDATWQRVLDYFEAKAELEWLKATDPAALAAAMGTAEGVYGDALLAAAAAGRSMDYLVDAYALRKANAESTQAALTTRLLGAARGDAD